MIPRPCRTTWPGDSASSSRRPTRRSLASDAGDAPARPAFRLNRLLILLVLRRGLRVWLLARTMLFPLLILLPGNGLRGAIALPLKLSLTLTLGCGLLTVAES